VQFVLKATVQTVAVQCHFGLPVEAAAIWPPEAKKPRAAHIDGVWRPPPGNLPGGAGNGVIVQFSFITHRADVVCGLVLVSIIMDFHGMQMLWLLVAWGGLEVGSSDSLVGQPRETSARRAGLSWGAVVGFRLGYFDDKR